MDQIVLNSFRDEPEHKYLYCDSCNSLLPEPGFYCVKCEPPKGPDSFSEADLTFSQAMLRIALLTLLFVVIAVFRLDIDMGQVVSSGSKETPLKIAVDEDFKIFFKVNTGLANLRSLPNVKSSKIIDTISLGTQVEVVGTERGWSKVIYKPGPGVKAKTGWIATKLLDSEIK
ncbi:MAG: SH3 domain-containing protein [Nitrospinae bacterium]|nr:SH3 domain-containing protein [Nitrospinota bacterium]MZH14219.1 SH3 domain-containing protein [Nitrospinota bacterium]